MLETLSPNQKRLMDLIGSIPFGQIQNLHLCCGHPIFHPAPEVIEDYKINTKSAKQASLDERAKKWRAFFGYLENIGTGTVRSIEIQNRAPFRIKALKELS